MKKLPETVLAYIEKDDSYLMLFRNKKEKDINANKWIGVGGHFEENETPEDCAIREVKEETGYVMEDYKLRAVITFISDGYEAEYMYLFTCDKFSGKPIECSEGNLEWVKKEGAQQLNSIQYLYSEDKVLKSVMGTIASIGLSVELLDDSKPVLGLSRLHKDIKISGRTTREMVAKGVNLGKALQDSSNNFGGTGGGHDIAAGAMIPYESKDNFLHLVDEMVEYQLSND